MMRWPWSKPEPETRAECAIQSDAVVSALVEAAGGESRGDPFAIGALETAAGLWARSFAGCEGFPRGRGVRNLPGAVSRMIGRELCRRGEAVLCILDIAGGSGVRLIPGGSLGTYPRADGMSGRGFTAAICSGRPATSPG